MVATVTATSLGIGLDFTWAAVCRVPLVGEYYLVSAAVVALPQIASAVPSSVGGLMVPPSSDHR